ncbi:protein associated with UVRAG as autophagy enhancer isoform X2 [Mus musculus]|uniref:protein associated with UVRAG as autophagy enhancer isoform X2 n=1 Tax=Mus musculus TaxID=10090 RepID=UPI00167368D5|nr:protein associated with UVRAG as autophagy enhancer isoform X2 [Mus musculus]
MNSRVTPSGTTAIGELCFEHVHSIPGKMVSQSIGWGDSPVDLCEGSNRAFQDTDQPACQLDVRLLRHKASWINPLCVQQPLQELCPQRPTVQSSENHVVLDTPSPLRLSILSYRDSLAEMPLSENTADVICSNSAHCSGGKEGDFFLATEEQEVHLQQESLLKNPKTVATSPSPKEGSARSESPHLTASTDDGDARSSSRSHAWNFFPLETFMLPADVEKENLHFYAADIIISVIENMKCNLPNQQQPERWDTEDASRLRGTGAEMTFYTHIKQEPGSSASSHTGCEGCAALQVSPVAETLSYCPVAGEACKHDLNKLVMLELGKYNDITKGCRCSYNSSKSATCESNLSPAGCLARELFRGFCKCWMLSEVNCQLPGSPTTASSGVGDEEYAEEDFDSSVDAAREVMLKSRVPGTEDWVLPRCQIILTVHPPINVLKEFEQVPSHLTDECHIFSMDDFLRTKKGLLAPLLKDILRASLAHVDSCELCQGKGFICEFCQSTTVIFPFQTTTCRRCAACRACFHKQCFQSSRCPRCARIIARRQHLESLPTAAT